MDRLPPTLYHATPPGNVRDILRHGLVPQDESAPPADAIHTNRVFLSRFADPSYMNLPADKISGAVLLAVDTSFIDPSRLYPDDSIYAAYFNDQLEDMEIGDMFPDHYRRWGSSGSTIGFDDWMSDADNGPADDEIERLLAGRFGLTLWGSTETVELGEVGYEGRIPPEAVSLHSSAAALHSAALRVAGQYLYRDDPLFLAPDFSPKAAAPDDHRVELNENEHGGVTAFLFDSDGEQVDDAYADIHMGTADNFQGEDGEYDYFSPNEPIEESGTVAVLTGLELPDGIRGRGLGREMVETAARWALSHGAEAVYTHSVGAPADPDPEGFYEKLGFEVVERDSMGNPYMRLGPARTAAREPVFLKRLRDAGSLPPPDVVSTVLSSVADGTLIHGVAGSTGTPGEDLSGKIQSILDSGLDPAYWAKPWSGSPGEGHPQAVYLSLAWETALNNPPPNYVFVEPSLSKPLVLWSGDKDGSYTWGPALNEATGKSGIGLSSFLRTKGYDSVIAVRQDGTVGEVAYFGKKPLPAHLPESDHTTHTLGAVAEIMRRTAAVGDIYRGVKTVVEKYGGKGLFARFSDVPKIGIRPSTEHHDPYGVYFYPVDWLAENVGFGTTYVNLPYITVAKVRRSGWLNLATVRPAKARELAEKGGVLEEYEARTEGKGLNQSKGGRAGKRLWDAVEAKVKPFESEANKMEWNRIFGRMGVKAIYDPGTGSVNSAEPSQIVVLDLSLIDVVDVVENREDRKSVYYAVLKAVADEVLDEGWRVSGSHADGGILADGTVSGQPVALSVLPAKAGFEMEVALSYHDTSGKKQRIVSRGRMPNEWEDAPAAYLSEGHAQSISRSLGEVDIGPAGGQDAEDMLDAALRALTKLRLPDLTVEEADGGAKFWKNTGDGKIEGSLKVLPNGRRELELYAEDWLLFGGEDSTVIEIGPMRVSWEGSDPSSASADMADELSRAVQELRVTDDGGKPKDKIDRNAAAEIARRRTLSWMFPADILAASGQKYEKKTTAALRSARLRIAGQRYWHGSSGENIRRVAAAGFVDPGVPEGHSGQGYQKPMPGRTYATTDISYALIYAIDAAMVGQKLPDFDRFDGEGGVVSLEGEGDALPDEDWVGELISDCESHRRMQQGDPNARASEIQEWKKRLYGDLRRHLPARVVAMIESKPAWKLDEMATQSMIGKNVNRWLLKQPLTHALREALVARSPHHSYPGRMRVTGAWVFDKRKVTPKLKKDGSNFLALATEIPVVNPPATKVASSVEERCWTHVTETLAAAEFSDMNGMCLEASVVLCERLRDEGVDAKLVRRWSDDHGGHWTVRTPAGEFDPTIAWWGDSVPEGAERGRLYKVGDGSPHAEWKEDAAVDEAAAYRIAKEELGVDDLEDLYDNALEKDSASGARRVAMPYLHDPKCPHCGHVGPQDPMVEAWASLPPDYRDFLQQHYGDDKQEIARRLMWDRTVPTYCGGCGKVYLFEKHDADWEAGSRGDVPSVLVSARCILAADGLVTLGETIQWEEELYHGTSIEAAASIARGGFHVEQHGEMSCESVSLTRNPVAAEIFAGREGVLFEFDISLRLFVLPEFVYDAMGCYAGSGMCDEDSTHRIVENAAALKRIGAMPESWDPGTGELPDWSEWRDSGMDEHGWLERSLPGYDGVVVPGFDSHHPRAEAEIAVFDSAVRRLMDSVVSMSVGGKMYDTEGGDDGESHVDDGWRALEAIDPGEHSRVDAALHTAAAVVVAAGHVAPAKMRVYRAEGAGRGLMVDAMPGGIYFFPNREMAELWAGEHGEVIERTIDTSKASVQDVPEGEMERYDRHSDTLFDVIIRRSPDGVGKILEIVVFDDSLISGTSSGSLAPATALARAAVAVAGPDLTAVREFLEGKWAGRGRSTPGENCIATASFLSKLLPGAEVRGGQPEGHRDLVRHGLATEDEARSGGGWRDDDGYLLPHLWVEAGGMVYDLTADQFGGDPVTVAPAGGRYVPSELSDKNARALHAVDAETDVWLEEWEPARTASSDWDLRYPAAGDRVDGRAVLAEVPNTGSISASFGDWEELPEVREVPLSDFGGPGSVFYATDDLRRSRELASRIRESGEISPLIVAVDDDGPYILEGAHRFVALHELGAKSFPALVVIDKDNGTSTEHTEEMPPARQVVGKPRFVTMDELTRWGTTVAYYHGTTVEALRSIEKDGFIRAPVYMADTEAAALEFAQMASEATPGGTVVLKIMLPSPVEKELQPDSDLVGVGGFSLDDDVPVGNFYLNRDVPLEWVPWYPDPDDNPPGHKASVAWYYHGSAPDDILDVAQWGLLARDDRDGVSVTSDPDKARAWAGLKSRGGEDIEVFRIPASAIPDLTPEDAAPAEPDVDFTVNARQIPPEDLQIMRDGKWTPLLDIYGEFLDPTAALSHVASPEGLKLTHECVGSHHGQTDMVIRAEVDGRLVGYMSYAIFGDEAVIGHVEVAEDMRRQGIATAILQDLKREAAEDGLEVVHTNTTDDGTAWRKSIAASLSRAARALGEHLGETVTAYRALGAEHMEKVIQEGFGGGHHRHGVYYTADRNRGAFYARFMASGWGVMFELEADTSRSQADINDATEWQSSELIDAVRTAVDEMIDALRTDTDIEEAYQRGDSSDLARVLESWLGASTVADSGYDNIPDYHSLWQLVEAETKGTDTEITAAEAKRAIPPGRYCGNSGYATIVIDSRGVPGIDVEDVSGQAQALSHAAVPPERLKAVWLQSGMLEAAGETVPAGAESMADHVDVIPAKFNSDYDVDFVAEIEKQRDEARKRHESEPPEGMAKTEEDAYYFGLEEVADAMDSILDRWKDENDSTMPGHIYEKLIAGETVTPEDLDREERLVRYPLPEGRLRAVKAVRKALALGRGQGDEAGDSIGRAARRAAGRLICPTIR